MSDATKSPPHERPAAPAPAPRTGRPPRIVLNGGPALWVGPLFMVLILGAGIAGRINGTTETPPLAFVVFGFAVLATTVAVSWRRADLRLWREGQAVAGELTKSYRKSSGSGESRTTHSYVRYRYTVEGVDYERRRRSKRVEEPRPIWVLHDPQKPGKSMPTW